MPGLQCIVHSLEGCPKLAESQCLESAACRHPGTCNSRTHRHARAEVKSIKIKPERCSLGSKQVILSTDAKRLMFEQVHVTATCACKPIQSFIRSLTIPPLCHSSSVHLNDSRSANAAGTSSVTTVETICSVGEEGRGGKGERTRNS